MDSFPLLVALFFIALTLFRSLQRRRRNLPPGPFPLPIIGNMLQLGSKPHESFTKLSKKYGPLMSIHLGSLYTVIATSPEMAKEILHKHGQVFSGRIIMQAAQACDHDKFSIAFLPETSGIWRGMRKLCREEMFSHTSLEGSKWLRQQKQQQLLDYVQKCSDTGRAVNIREAAFISTLNLMSATLFSTQASEFDSKETMELKEIMEGLTQIIGEPNLADYFPFLKPFDPQRVKRRAENYFRKLIVKMEGYVSERMESRRVAPKNKKNDFLETLIDSVEANEYKFTTDHLTRLLLDLFVAGTETNAISIEWVMAELAMNLDKMAILRAELKSVVGQENKLVEESDMARLPYLQAVIKEALRLHPAGPFLIPHKAESDQEVNGYLIPKGTQVLVNVWAIGRDPSIWKNPTSFQPERFAHLEIDYKGQNYELLTFSSGRRMCPGMPLADRILHMTTANLIHNFDWKLEPGTTAADHDGGMTGVAMPRAVPLRIIPIKS